jgi:hypothetical protein
MNATAETTRQRNTRLRAAITAARTEQTAAVEAYDNAYAAACATPDTVDWEAVYALEAAAHRSHTEVRMAENEYTLRDVPQATRDLVSQNID